MEENSYNFKVKFGSDKPAINTETYVQALKSLTTIVQEINYQKSSSESISIHVVAENEGSFDVSLALQAAENLFNHSSGTINFLGSLVSLTGGVIYLKKKLKKADLDKTEFNNNEVIIKDIDGNVIYTTSKEVYNIYTTNQVVQDAVTDNFRSLNKDKDINGYEINYDNETIHVSREEFSELAEKDEVELPEQEITEVPAHLIIIKVVFEGEERKWDFLHNGTKISATIRDQRFWEQIKSGKAFSKGDEVVADLRIVREYDEEINAYTNKEYQIVNVRDHTPREYREQLNIDDMRDQNQ